MTAAGAAEDGGVAVSDDESETRQLGKELACRLVPGDLVLLEGNLGAGKTVFVKGLAAGLGLNEAAVASPTFALVHEYGPDGVAPVLAHVDLYRLSGDSPAALEELGLRDLRRGGAILAIEWPRPFLFEAGAWHVRVGIEKGTRRRIEIRRL